MPRNERSKQHLFIQNVDFYFHRCLKEMDKNFRESYFIVDSSWFRAPNFVVESFNPKVRFI